MTKRYGSLLELLSDSNDQEVLDLKEKLESNSRSMELARTLFNIRNMQGVSQEDIAEKMGISVEDVDEIEHCSDDDMKMSIFGGYILALGFTINFGIHKDRVSDTVSYHLHRIREAFNEIQEEYKSDPEMKQKAAEYIGNTFLSFGRSVDDAVIGMDEIIEIPTNLFRAIILLGDSNSEENTAENEPQNHQFA